MSWFRRAVGLDFMDVLIQTGVTVALVATVAAGNGPVEAIGAIVAASFVVLGARRHFALKRAGEAPGLSTGQMAAERLEELEQRVAELEANQVRLAELEDRLDFAERLLARVEDRAALGRGGSG